MRSLDPLEEKALEDPDVLIGYFSDAGKQGRTPVETHRTHLLKKLFTLAGETPPASLQQTTEDTYNIAVTDLMTVVKKLEAKLKP